MRFNLKIKIKNFNSKSKIINRNIKINKNFLNRILNVYNGKKLSKIFIEPKHLNHYFGEFSFTRKLGKIHTIKKIR